MSTKEQRSAHSNARLAALCFVAGFIDIVAFISVLGMFVGHVTSNLTIAGFIIVADATASMNTGRSASRAAKGGSRRVNAALLVLITK